MDKFKFQFSLPILKVDDEQRMVYGYASTDDLDSDEEIISLDALKEALPDYMQFPTLREMHQPKVAGTTKEAAVDDTGLYIGAKIIDDNAWKMVKEDGYKGFSIGGNVVRKTGNVINQLDLIEISLVDVPANKEAKIELWKAKKKEKKAPEPELKKDAYGVYSMANLMMYIKDMLNYYEYQGKDTKKLLSMLDDCKSLVIAEAKEDEPGEGDKVAERKAEFKKFVRAKIVALEKLKFDNPIEEVLRKGVLESMIKKEEEIKNEETAESTSEASTVEENKEETTTSAGEPSEAAVTTEEPKTEEAATEGGEATTTEEPKTEVVENGEPTPEMAKLQEIEKTLGKLNPETIVKKEEVQSITKTVSQAIEVIGKMAKTISSLSDRLTKVEGTPAALKSKGVFVKKAIDGATVTEHKTEVKQENKELAQKTARLEELNKLFDEIGANDFAKRGHSLEAGRLEQEIAQLKTA